MRRTAASESPDYYDVEKNGRKKCDKKAREAQDAMVPHVRNHELAGRHHQRQHWPAAHLVLSLGASAADFGAAAYVGALPMHERLGEGGAPKLELHGTSLRSELEATVGAHFEGRLSPELLQLRAETQQASLKVGCGSRFGALGAVLWM